MTQVFGVLLTWLDMIFDMLLSTGGIIGTSIVCWPLFSRILRSLRSIISRN